MSATWTVFELNEAFASQTLAGVKALELTADNVNVNGGAIALGHPIGASGARVLVTLLHVMRQTGAKKGVTAVCLGGRKRRRHGGRGYVGPPGGCRSARGQWRNRREHSHRHQDSSGHWRRHHGLRHRPGVLPSRAARCSCRTRGPGAVDHAVVTVEKSLDKLVKKEKITADLAAATKGNLHSAKIADMKGADLVVEAIFEDPAAKRELYAELSEVIAPDVIFASNTSRHFRSASWVRPAVGPSSSSACTFSTPCRS